MRLREVDFVISNGGVPRPTEYLMTLEPLDAINLADRNKVLHLSDLKGQCVRAVAGIGNPERFFTLLESFGCEVLRNPFCDHHLYTAQDFDFPDNLPIIMTEKDAVKCESLARDNLWCIGVEAVLDEAFVVKLMAMLSRLQKPIEEKE